jgi:acyl-coenzyme A thioesterase PaaI-like protein
LPVPTLDEWRSRWEQPEHRQLGLRGEAIEAGYACFAVERPEGADDLLLRSAITIAADIAAISAVQAQLDDRQQPNGTAELHLSFIAPLPDSTVVDARVIDWADYTAHLELEVRGPGDSLVARGLTTYSLRPAAPAGGGSP